MQTLIYNEWEVICEMFKLERREFVNKTFRLPLSLVEELQELAQCKNMSLNQLVIRCCEYALDDLAEEDRPADWPDRN